MATRLTPLPQRDYVPRLRRPRGRLARAWRELRTADPEVPRGVPATQGPGQLSDATIAAREQADSDTAVLEPGRSRQAAGQNESDA